MSTLTSSTTTWPPPQGEFIGPLVQGALPSERKLDDEGALMRQPSADFTVDRGLVACVRKLWRAARAINADFKRAGDGTRSRERSAERLRDEQAWLRLDDEG
jgi:hypothetical protein